MSNTFFEKLVGKENISDEIIDREVYSTDGSQIKGKTERVIWVKSAKEVHQIVLYAKRNRKSIIARGAGTSLVGSAVPHDGIVVDFSNMNKIFEDGGDYVVVEPGVVLDDLNKMLGDKFFPVIPEDSAVCTIGGMCGINSSGIYERKYGRMKNWVESVEMVDGNARLKSYGSEVIGKEGTLGLIVKIKLRLADKITQKSMDVFKFDTSEEAIEKAASLKNEKNVLLVDFINARAARLNGLTEKYHLIVEYEGSEGNIKDKFEMDRIWKIRNNLFSNLAKAGYYVMEDPMIPIDNMIEIIMWLEKRKIPVFGPIGSNVLFPCFENRDLLNDFYNEVVRLNGGIGSRFGIGILKKDYLNEVLKDDWRKMKVKFDPENIMNRGKVI